MFPAGNNGTSGETFTVTIITFYFIVPAKLEKTENRVRFSLPC